MCKVFLEKKNVNLRLFNYCVKFHCLRNSVTVYINVNTKNRKPNISMRTVRTYITYFEIYFSVGLATIVSYYCAEMRNACRLCYTLTVKCSFSMSCTDFGFLFIQRDDDCIADYVSMRMCYLP